jgi:AmmeMemoRadiSam system protein B
VMRAARALGATRASILRYADSGDVSGDKTAVVGYVAAAFSGGSRTVSGHAH